MRVRFAPSPTGFLHIGNARTAVINYLIAKKEGASLVLRIEDTDRERSSVESEESILRDLRWLGIEWDEGPDKGGEYGPYRQSERFDIYSRYTEKLLAAGDAYPCYCTKEELEARKKKIKGDSSSFEYDGRCRDLTEEERKAFEAEGRKPVIRFRVPENETIRVEDDIKGRVSFKSGNIGGDFIIVRSDGVPVYNYIVVIDDALMEISHVIRGEDHLSNTPKQILVAKALGFTAPQYAHLALVLGPDRSKLSKRHGITSVEMYRDEGYLPDALFNYLAMLGWAAEGGEEILTKDEIIAGIDLPNMAKSAAVFDFKKLKWMNGQYIRSYDSKNLIELFSPYIEKAGYDINSVDKETRASIIGLLAEKCELLPDIGSLISIFLDDVPGPDADAAALLSEEGPSQIIDAAYGFISSPPDTEDFFNPMVAHIKEATSLKGKHLFMPIRAILTCSLKGPDMGTAVPLIGYEKCKVRIEFWHNRAHA